LGEEKRRDSSTSGEKQGDLEKEKPRDRSTSVENEDGPGLQFRRKLYMTKTINIVLNVNAVFLLAVFIFLYAFFA
jgi:hypothetical protein